MARAAKQVEDMAAQVNVVTGILDSIRKTDAKGK